MKDMGRETMRPSLPGLHLVDSALRAGLVQDFAER